jgi:hypothetical protein
MKANPWDWMFSTIETCFWNPIGFFKTMSQNSKNQNRDHVETETQNPSKSEAVTQKENQQAIENSALDRKLTKEDLKFNLTAFKILFSVGIWPWDFDAEMNQLKMRRSRVLLTMWNILILLRELHMIVDAVYTLFLDPHAFTSQLHYTFLQISLTLSGSLIYYGYWELAVRDPQTPLILFNRVTAYLRQGRIS